MPTNNTNQAAGGQTEVVPEDGSRYGQTIIGLRPVQWSMATVWESPFFWMIVGAGLTLGAIYLAKKKL